MSTTYDPTLFQGAAWYYARYRRAYPDSFYHHITKVFDLDKNSRALDLGTGTGQVAIPLSQIVREVVADQAMLAEGHRLAVEQVVDNIIWLNMRAEDISEELGMFDLTTMGISFHWMQQDDVLDKVFRLTNPGGGVAIIGSTSSIHRNRGNDPWKDVALATIKKFIGDQRLAGQGYFQGSKEKYEDILKRSKFQPLDKLEIQYPQVWSIDQLIGVLYSTSYARQEYFGNRIDEFEQELRANLLKLDSRGQFTETAFLEALIGQK